MTIDDAVAFFDTHQRDKNQNKTTASSGCGTGICDAWTKFVDTIGWRSATYKAGLLFGKRVTKAETGLFIFDEPTTGLHFHDIKKLLKSFNALIDKGHSVVVVEHNLDLIKCADHVIDLGPEGGANGGYVLAEGTPESVLLSPENLQQRNSSKT